MQIKDCVFKDELKHKKQMERARKEEDKEQEEMKTCFEKYISWEFDRQTH